MLCDVMMSVADGHLTRVNLNVPPGSMKSSLLNVCFPAWLWGPRNRPSMRFLSISYSDKVPTRDNLRFAEVIKSPLYQQCWGDRVGKITRDGAEVVGNDKTGWKMVASVSGSTTGLRADILCLDDLNNPMDVESEPVRLTTNRFVREIMPTRLNDLQKSAIINLQQRTHQEDATGTLLENDPSFTFISIPAEFDPLRICEFTLRYDEDGAPVPWIDPRALDRNGRRLKGLTTNARGEPMVQMGSPLARVQGESFWPERFPDPIRDHFPLMTQYAWDAQFNQVPGVRGGAIIRRDWWKLWPDEQYPDLGTVIVSVDTAYEQGETNDYNAVTAWGVFAGRQGEPLFLMLCAWRIRCPLADLVRLIAETCRERKADYLLIEHKTRGRDVHDEIHRIYGRATWQTELVKVVGDKTSRLQAVSHLFSGDARKLPDGVDSEGKPQFRVDWSGGCIYAPDKAWADEVITEVASFPYGSHDDYVDTISMTLSWARKNSVVTRKEEWAYEEEERARYKPHPRIPYSM
jgi:phage terminase large subunit-like protein